MTGIEVRLQLQKGAFRLNADFTAPGAGVTALFGPSGAGKTSVLRCLAGLEPTARGHVRIQQECWQDHSRDIFRPTPARRIGYVFQHTVLFDHLDVRGNIEYGWRRAPESTRLAIDEVVNWLGIAHLLQRQVDSLSGGERQRVAIARALLAAPKLLLLDEPLASLDAAGKAEILPYLEKLPARLSIPVLLVSHSMDEVTRLADHLIWIDNGRCRSGGPLIEMLARLDMPPAQADDAGVILAGVVAQHDAEFNLTYLDAAAGRITLPAQEHAIGTHVRVRIAARDVSITLQLPSATSILNCFPARVLEIGAAGPAQNLVKLDANGSALLARITRKSCAHLQLAPGVAVFAQVKSVALVG